VLTSQEASAACTPPMSGGVTPAKEDETFLERKPSSSAPALVSEVLEDPTCMDDKTRDQKWLQPVLPRAEDNSLEVFRDETKLLNTGLSGSLSEFCLDSNPRSPQTPAPSASDDWMTYVKGVESEAGSDAEVPSCGQKRSASFLDEGTHTGPAPPRFPCASRRVSRLGWSLPRHVDPKFVFRKVDKFLRDTGCCEELSKSLADYEISGLYQLRLQNELDCVQGFCRFRLNFFMLDDSSSATDVASPGTSTSTDLNPDVASSHKSAGTHLQCMRALGDSFVYHNLVRKLGRHLSTNLGGALDRCA